jgi:hypothetical protein
MSQPSRGAEWRRPKAMGSLYGASPSGYHEIVALLNDEPLATKRFTES